MKQIILFCVFIGSAIFWQVSKADTIKPVDYVIVPGSTDLDIVFWRCDAQGNSTAVKIFHVSLPLTQAKLQKVCDAWAYDITSTAATHDNVVNAFKNLTIQASF